MAGEGLARRIGLCAAHGFGIETLFASICLWLMPLYRYDCAPWPTWLLVPSHLSQPTVHPFLLDANARARAG